MANGPEVLLFVLLAMSIASFAFYLRAVNGRRPAQGVEDFDKTAA
jgi:hypothetical protein